MAAEEAVHRVAMMDVPYDVELADHREMFFFVISCCCCCCWAGLLTCRDRMTSSGEV